jgi:hypothetical protein
MNIDKRHAATQQFTLTNATPTDEQLLDELDQLVARAGAGDSRAVGSIAIAFGPALLHEVRAELGQDHTQDDADVLQTFFLELMDEKLRVPRIRGGALPWMRRTVRMFARRHLAARGPDWDLAG